MVKASIFAPLTLTAGLVAAQSLSLSESCQNALGGVVTNSDTANCLNPSALISIALNGGNTSVVQPIDNWLGGMCSAAPCSNATLEATTRSVIQGCSTDLASIGLGTDESSISSVVSQIQLYYPTVRKIACLKKYVFLEVISANTQQTFPSSNTFCVTELLTEVQNTYGPLTINNLPNLLASISPTQLPTNITCSSCSKEAYNIIKQDFPVVQSDSDPMAQAECGASFIDGTTPEGITQTASNVSAGSNNNSASAPFSTLGGFAVLTSLAASSVFVLFM
ncbi:hypothetical protein ONZ45_g18539 [Pleurotus djamor]|nr:hypothetical protein ONZ45_g18539 [Pleurotus djamor]